jgi:hypothetical protein
VSHLIQLYLQYVHVHGCTFAVAVRFMEPQWAPPELQQRILSHMNAWGCSITFALVSEALLFSTGSTCRNGPQEARQ